MPGLTPSPRVLFAAVLLPGGDGGAYTSLVPHACYMGPGHSGNYAEIDVTITKLLP